MILENKRIDEIINTKIRGFSERDYLTGARELKEFGSILSLIIHDYENTGDYTRRNEIRKKIKESIEVVLNGAEPTFTNCHNWGYPALCQSLMLIKNKDVLWNLFNKEEKEKITCIMKMFARMWTLGCNRYNHFRTGISLKGNYSLNWNPNYILANDCLILYLYYFFDGLREINNFIKNDKYEDVLSELAQHNFKNAYNSWTVEGFELPDGTYFDGSKEMFGDLEKRISDPNYKINVYIKDTFGNIQFAGYGKGCTIPFYYGERDNKVKDFRSYPDCVYNKLLNRTFSGGKCVSSVKITNEENFYAKILDGTTSPYEGQDGMIKEFNSTDSMGDRSSIIHSKIDFYLVAMLIESLKLVNKDILGEYDKPELVIVGMKDCLYKIEHGYKGYSLGGVEREERLLRFIEWENLWK